MQRIAIIGAGLAGISCARQLADHAQVTLFDKSKGVGGRMATRRACDDLYKFDHGAQYFTAQTSAFKSAIKPLITAGDVLTWEPYFYGEDDHDPATRFVGAPAMNVIGKKLMKGLDVVQEVLVTQMECLAGLWYLTDDQGRMWGQYDAVVLAMPSEQAKALVPNDFQQAEILEQVEMLPCFTVMLGFSGHWTGDWDAVRSKDQPVAFAAVNSEKPGRGRSAVTSIVLQSSNLWAKAHVDDDLDEVMQLMLENFETQSGVVTKFAKHKAIHRWLYASVGRSAGQHFLSDEPRKLYLCGDWCIESRMEAAFNSGYALGGHIKRQILA